MTFKEWWKANSYKFPQADYSADGYEEVAKAAWNIQQAAIDRLMLEYCPEEMSPEQRAEWERHQKALDEPIGTFDSVEEMMKALKK